MAEPCSACHPRLSALLDGALSAEDQAAVEDHLAACGDCSARLADLALGSQLVRAGLTAAADEVDWKAFTDRVMEKVEPARPSLRAWLEGLFGALLPQGGLGWAAAGAVGVALVVGVGYLGFGRSGTPAGAGYKADTMAVKAVQAEPDVSPVVLEAEAGGAIIFLVDHPQRQLDVAAQPADAGTPKTNEGQEEGGDL
ncbi:MAG: zf-HC2 domain-containing protein [Deltaproteobacteria bacterium]|nr:zf-HC2 domain-containing protein [Deltaproteobacteria bacterium]